MCGEGKRGKMLKGKIRSDEGIQKMMEKENDQRGEGTERNDEEE